MDKIKKEVLEETIYETQKAIARADMWEDFYGAIIKDIEDEQEKAKHQSKLDTILANRAFNQKVLEFLKK